MTIFLTGATGFIGRHVLGHLLNEGHEVVALVRQKNGVSLPVHPHLRLLEKEMVTVVKADLDGCEVLIHLAAHGVTNGMNDWESCFRVNVHESMQMWFIAINAGIRRLVICGSCFEYGRSGERYDFIPVEAPLEPTGAYHASKAAASMAALGLAVDQNLEVVVARPFHVFGEGEAQQRFWPSLRSAAIAGDDFAMTSGEQIRDFVPVESLADDFMCLATRAAIQPGHPQVINLGSGHPTSLRQFAETWWARWGALGRLKVGALPLRPNEVMRYVPYIESATALHTV